MATGRPAASVALALVLACTATAAGCGLGASGDSGATWRFAIEEAQGSVQDAYAREFERRIEQRTANRPASEGGPIDVVVYPYGTLGTSDQLTELVHNGSIPFAMASPGHMGKIIPEVQVFLLHHLMSGDEAINNAALSDPELLAHFDRLYARKGFALLALYGEGEMVWTTRKPIRRPGDFAGVKMRVMTSPLLLAAYDAYGASPTPLPYSEVYSALQLNMIDGQVNPVFAIQEMSFYEVTDYMIFPGHAEFITSAMANRQFYEGLPAADRQMVDEVIAELQGFALATQRAFNDERLALIRERKPDIEVVRLTAEERAAFREVSRKVWDRFVASVGEGARRALDEVQAAVSRAEATASD